MVKNKQSRLRAIAACVATIVFGASIALLPASAWAAKKKANNEGGRAEFERAARYYKAQEYDAALPWFQKAYELSGKRPSTIRALAQCERSLKMYDRSIEHFREYLATNPPAAEAKSVRQTIALMEELKTSSDAIAEAKKKDPADLTPAIDAPPAAETQVAITEQKKTEVTTEVETPPASVLRETPPPRYSPQTTQPPLVTADTNLERKSSKVVPWIVTGGSVAAAIAGGVLFAMGRSDVNTVESAPDGTPYRGEISDAAGRAPTFTGVGLGLLVAGVAGTGIGITMLISD